MALEVSWLIEGRLMNARFVGNVTLEELESAVNVIMEMLTVGDSPLIHSVHDASALTAMPISLSALSNVTGEAYKHPRLGWVVAHSVQNRVVGFIGNMMGRLFQTRYRIFDTRAEALAFLNSMDETLPALEAFAEVPDDDGQASA